MRSTQGPSGKTVTHPYSDSESVQSEWMYFTHLFSIQPLLWSEILLISFEKGGGEEEFKVLSKIKELKPK